MGAHAAGKADFGRGSRMPSAVMGAAKGCAVCVHGSGEGGLFSSCVCVCVCVCMCVCVCECVCV